nr:hypothetical protein [Sphingomonas sp. CDS-1]
MDMGETGGEVAKSLIGPVGDGLSDAFGLMIGDRLANWRLQNVIKSHAKVQNYAKEHGLKLRAEKIPTRFAYSWFEETSKQDNDDLQNLFAKLLARTAGGEVAPDERLVRILSMFTPDDARVFQLFYQKHESGTLESLFRSRHWGHWEEVKRAQFARGVKELVGQSHEMELEHLVSIGCLKQFTSTEVKAFPSRIKITDISKVDLSKIIKDNTSPVTYLSHTELGKTLASSVI